MPSLLSFGIHCVKRVHILSFFWSIFSRIWTGYGEIFSPNAGKYRPEKTPYLDTFHPVIISLGADSNDFSILLNDLKIFISYLVDILCIAESKLDESFLDLSQRRPIRSVLLVIIGWLVGNAVSSETALRIFLIFCMKLGDYKGRKVTEPDF